MPDSAGMLCWAIAKCGAPLIILCDLDRRVIDRREDDGQ
jgi:hypothetical protein